MGVPNSQLTTNFVQLFTFTSLQRILFRHNPNFPSSANQSFLGVGPTKNKVLIYMNSATGSCMQFISN